MKLEKIYFELNKSIQINNNCTWNKLESQFKKLKIFEKKVILNRHRLRFSQSMILFYMKIFILHIENKTYFKQLYKLNKLEGFVSYSSFMKNITKITPLFEFLFRRIVREETENTTINSIDSSLISCVKPKSIRQKHWDKGVCTVRKDKRENKIYICGVKLFCVLNEHKKIINADVVNINIADISYLKNKTFLFKDKKLLADRGFNSTFLQNNLKSFKLISPPKGRKCRKLTREEKILYKKRWEVETSFQKIKDKFGIIKLSPSFKYNLSIVKATIFYSLLKYNLNF